MEVLKSQKGKDILCFGGFMYRKNSSSKSRQCWRCVQSDCHGSASTALNYEAVQDVKTCAPHNHCPDPRHQGITRVMNTLSAEASTSHAAPRRIISGAVDDVDDDVLAVLPTRKALNARIQRKRRRIEGGVPPEPVSAEDLVLPENYQRTSNGARFLLYDGNQGHGRVILFASDAMLMQLQHARTIMCDGTFKVSPRMFFQLYTVHAVRDNCVFPCVYALLPGKNRDIYDIVWNEIKQACPQLAPLVVITDLESAAIASASAAFPGASAQACFFHLSQAVWRKVQNLGLTNLYINDPEARTYCKLLCALAFIPPNDVTHSFEELEDRLEAMPFANELQPLYSYFEDTYIGRPRRRQGRRPPNFAIDLWNVRSRTVDGVPRTTNKLEGWHRAIQLNFDSNHPSIWRFIDGLRREEGLQYAALQQYLAGDAPPAEPKRYRDMNRRLSTLVHRHVEGEMPTEDFLRGVSHNINMNV